MVYDVIVVGGGIAGLTAAAFLAKAGKSVLLCEKENSCGGLVNTFERDGFVYDGGIRAMENSGVLFPMLKQLGLEIEFVKNNISLGIEDKVIRIHSEKSVNEYQALLSELYPDSREEISEIIVQIRKIMKYLDVQYGIDNPAFLDMKEDREYMIKEIIPWMFKYALTYRKIAALNTPVEPFLKRFTNHQPLVDIIAQHFFQDTPAFFALSYFKLYLDYYYPIGGTGKVIENFVSFINENGGLISTGTEISSVDPGENRVVDSNGNILQYRRLVWAADLITLYQHIDLTKIRNDRIKKEIQTRYANIEKGKGNDSIFTLYLAANLPLDYFASKHSEHFFYTPSKAGQSIAGKLPINGDKDSIKNWLQRYFALTTYEISCPIMRDSTLAPEGKTGLVISVLFDYQLTKQIQEMGWYEEFKSLAEHLMIETLENSIYPGIRNAILHQFSSTPLTIQRYTGNTEGAITGWSFTNDHMPAENRLLRIFNATKTPIPGIVKAGQWSFSPSGLPISILTGKLAADRVNKDLST